MLSTLPSVFCAPRDIRSLLADAYQSPGCRHARSYWVLDIQGVFCFWPKRRYMGDYTEADRMADLVSRLLKLPTVRHCYKGDFSVEILVRISTAEKRRIARDVYIQLTEKRKL